MPIPHTLLATAYARTCGHTSSKRAGSEGGVRLVSIVILNAAFLTGGTTLPHMRSGSSIHVDTDLRTRKPMCVSVCV